MTTINSKENRNKIIYGREIFNKRYLFNNNTIYRNFAGAVCSKLFNKKVNNKIINYLEKIGLNNFRDWNYAEDQFFTDLIKLFSDTYVFIDTIYYFYFINPDSLCQKRNKEKIFEDHLKYFNYFNDLTKQFQLNNDFLICNLIKFFIFNVEPSEKYCTKIKNLIQEININRINPTEYWRKGYEYITDTYNYYCSKFK